MRCEALFLKGATGEVEGTAGGTFQGGDRNEG